MSAVYPPRMTVTAYSYNSDADTIEPIGYLTPHPIGYAMAMACYRRGVLHHVNSRIGSMDPPPGLNEKDFSRVQAVVIDALNEMRADPDSYFTYLERVLGKFEGRTT